MTTGFKTLSKALSHSSILSQRSQSVPFGSLLIKAWTDYSICPSPFKPPTNSLIFKPFCRKGYGIQRKMIIGSILGVQAPTTAEKAYKCLQGSYEASPLFSWLWSTGNLGKHKFFF